MGGDWSGSAVGPKLQFCENWLPGTDSKSAKKHREFRRFRILLYADTPKDTPPNRWLRPDVVGWL